MEANRRFKQWDATPDRIRVDFIKRELRTGITFARLAQTETSMGMLEDATRAEASARRAYAEFTRFLPMVEHHLSAKDRTEIEEMRIQLEHLLIIV